MRSRVVLTSRAAPRAGKAVAFFGAVIALFAAASCSEGGTGVGTAPPLPPACPAAPPAGGTPCTALQMCPYEGTCPDLGGSCFAFCPGGANPTWEIVAGGDAGTFADAPFEDALPEVLDDAPPEMLDDAIVEDALPDTEPADTEPADTEPPVDDGAVSD